MFNPFSAEVLDNLDKTTEDDWEDGVYISMMRMMVTSLLNYHLWRMTHYHRGGDVELKTNLHWKKSILLKRRIYLRKIFYVKSKLDQSP